jgi:hypothetical protein
MASEALAGPAAARRGQLRRYALYGAAAVLAGTLAYKAYSSNSVAQTRRSLARLRAALAKYSEALSSGADLCCTVVRDLQRFLQSDSSEVPGSLRQLAKLLQSQEVTQTTTKTVAAVYRGVAGKLCRGTVQLGQPAWQPGRGCSCAEGLQLGCACSTVLLHITLAPV